MPDIIYVLTNEAMPGLVKIGQTTDNLETRIRQLSTHTGVPLPFECYFAAVVNDCTILERKLHLLFSEDRVNPRREFFKIDPEKVVLAISIAEFKEITPGANQIDQEDQAALEKVKARRPRLKLDALGIKPGNVLTLSRDESIVAIVADDGKSVEFKGEVLSLSAAALKALHTLHYSTLAASGPGYWMFNGELLDERRRNMEAAQFDDTSPTNV